MIDQRGRRITLHEDPSGRRLAILSSGEMGTRRRFLADGRVASGQGRRGTRVRVFSSDGDEQKVIPIRAGRVGESSSEARSPPDTRRREPSGKIGLGRFGGPSRGHPNRAIAAGRPPPVPRDRTCGCAHRMIRVLARRRRQSDELFYGADGSLVHLDASTGEQRVILAGRPSS